jgi:hypothetical protein
MAKPLAIRYQYSTKYSMRLTNKQQNIEDPPIRGTPSAAAKPASEMSGF